MQPSGDASDDTGALPARQTWYLARRRLFIALFSIISASMIVLALAWWSVDAMEPGLRVTVTVGHAGLSVFPALAAWRSSKVRLEADADGLHLVEWPRTMTYRWKDIIEIRPSILNGKRTNLVLVRRGRETIDLPVTEEHLNALRRWHRAAST